jgi:ubiquitin carboxyl-terminal hydrolase 5/13
LVVKLGTIDATGAADVYSYDEDTDVTDPYLNEHLLRFGLDMKCMQRTTRTLEELQVEMNLKSVEFNDFCKSVCVSLCDCRHDWSAVANAGDGTCVYGAGRTGLVNLGNSCYMNSVCLILRLFRRRQMFYL